MSFKKNKKTNWMLLEGTHHLTVTCNKFIIHTNRHSLRYAHIQICVFSYAHTHTLYLYINDSISCKHPRTKLLMQISQSEADKKNIRQWNHGYWRSRKINKNLYDTVICIWWMKRRRISNSHFVFGKFRDHSIRVTTAVRRPSTKG